MSGFSSVGYVSSSVERTPEALYREALSLPEILSAVEPDAKVVNLMHAYSKMHGAYADCSAGEQSCWKAMNI